MKIIVISNSNQIFKKVISKHMGNLETNFININENTIEEYVENLSKHLDDCYRILDIKGSFYLNLGDVIIDGHLQSAPHKVLFRLLERKPWIHRSTIVYAKTNPKPSSSKSNLTPSYEFIFHLVKSLEYDYFPTRTSLSKNTKNNIKPDDLNNST